MTLKHRYADLTIDPDACSQRWRVDTCLIERPAAEGLTGGGFTAHDGAVRAAAWLG